MLYNEVIFYFQCLQLIYISDGNYDAGHYDLVVESPDQSEEIEQIYQVWRQQKIQELHSSCDSGDNKSYGWFVGMFLPS